MRLQVANEVSFLTFKTS